MKHFHETSDKGDKTNTPGPSIAPDMTVRAEDGKATAAPMPAGFASHDELLKKLAPNGCSVEAQAAHPILAAIHGAAQGLADGAEHSLESAASFVYHHPWESAGIGLAAVGVGVAAPEVAAWAAVGALGSWVGTLATIETAAFTSIPLDCDPNVQH